MDGVFLGRRGDKDLQEEKIVSNGAVRKGGVRGGGIVHTFGTSQDGFEWTLSQKKEEKRKYQKPIRDSLMGYKRSNPSGGGKDTCEGENRSQSRGRAAPNRGGGVKADHFIAGGANRLRTARSARGMVHRS